MPGGSTPPCHLNPKYKTMTHALLFLSVPALVGAYHLVAQYISN